MDVVDSVESAIVEFTKFDGATFMTENVTLDKETDENAGVDEGQSPSLRMPCTMRGSTMPVDASKNFSKTSSSHLS